MVGVIVSASVWGDLPHTEEAQHVINTVRVEVLLHMRQATAPPAASILMHIIPIVRRESPILLWISRCSSVSVKLEQVRLGPDVSTAFGHANGQISLQSNTHGLAVK